NERKRKIASQYDAFIDRNIKKPVVLSGTYPVYRDYFILVEDRDELKASLLKEGIETKLGYTPLHLLKTFENFLGSKKNFSVAEAIADKTLLLPCFWGMTDSQLKRVCATLRGSKNVGA
ncbi:MAG: DegT/DnrJ/EryC1/StrS family aminotransferase, partial [Candidatus Omnitrophica bacterium]|nr:DegT/DnrJ/EryC1/StrS family aminotransferase [Candidatus Omnitrophota bacterium]